METEQFNPRTHEIDVLLPGEILRRISEEDSTVPGAVARELPAIEAAVRRVIEAFEAGGRLIYVGAGTSGRLGVLDAAECPPTYGTSPRQVQALIAGGQPAMTSSVEAAEDDEEQGAREIASLGVDQRDVVLGIAASGRTPYVVGALRQARNQGAFAVALVGDRAGPVALAADLVIAPQTGPEVVAGSTRMKAGTAQKLVLNMISTTAMICTGHTFGNLMVDMHTKNSKLRSRARAMVIKATGVSEHDAVQSLVESGGEVKTAIMMLLAGLTAPEARERLAMAGGVVRRALQAGDPRARS
jgi:N-acetylmuramic acid 6-phosphate etherase